MESFEKLVGGLLERQGYWVRYAFKVELSKAEKLKIGRPSSPRWELDIVAYRARGNKVLVVECKSYLDSFGVRYKAIVGKGHRRSSRYKLFNDASLRRVIFKRLVHQLTNARACRSNPRITLCLAAGKVVSEPDAKKLRALFLKQGWSFFDPQWIKNSLRDSANLSYEDDVATVVAKILLRNRDLGN
ncbi:MAG TPA: hypothetical protein VGR55_02135 [Candidatus Acidoferrum sp.]|nr:hypothetical protein [Candidatus Acidoferrum sp.]